MSIVASDLRFHCAASMPENDTGTSGGAIDTAARPEFTQLSANAVTAALSDGADTRNLTITGRNAAGAIVGETIALNGVTEIVFTTTLERWLKWVLASSSGTRIVTVKQGSGGTTRGTIGLNETTRRLLFYDSASDPSSIKIRYEKVFALNAHATLTLTSAKVTLTADPAARIRIGLATTLNDTGSVTNRLTAPGGVTFVDDSVAQNVVGGALAAGDKQGTWIEQNLPAADPAQKSTFTLELFGTTT